ncbi:histone H2A-like [Cornus florida]|uniref:histone H2A-like n=1 Tax=Cornus florida TaxID=4283 RepID=UPI0028995679|nr:histone H2A-like [Cornus florida]
MKAGKKAKKGGGGRNGGGPKNIPVSCSVESGGLPVERIGRYSQRVGTVGPVYLGAEERDSVRKINGMSSVGKSSESLPMKAAKEELPQ